MSKIFKVDREVLISEVQARPAIWNDADPNHKNVDFVEKKWCEIALILNKEVAELKSKWKNLRGKMRKEVLKMPRTKSGAPAPGWKASWEYFDLMLFIKDIILRAPATGNLSSFSQNSEGYSGVGQANDELESEEEDVHQVQSPEFQSPITSPDSAASTRTSAQARNVPYKRQANQTDTARLELEKRKIQILEDASVLYKQLMKNATNSDHNFLIRLLPFIEPLNLTEKLDLREKLQKEVKDAYKKHIQSQYAPIYTSALSVPVQSSTFTYSMNNNPYTIPTTHMPSTQPYIPRHQFPANFSHETWHNTPRTESIYLDLQTPATTNTEVEKQSHFFC